MFNEEVFKFDIDNIKNDFYLVKINQIITKENTIKYNNKYFYKYLLNFHNFLFYIHNEFHQIYLN